MPDSLMTNATVSGIASAPQGQDLKVTYKGGASEIVVGPNTPIFGYGFGNTSLLKPQQLLRHACGGPEGRDQAVHVTRCAPLR